MENKIIFKKENKNTDYFAIVIAIFTVLLLAFQVIASRHISKAGRDFIAREDAKRMEYREKARKAKMEKFLAAERLAKQQEEEAYLASIEAQNRPEQKDKFKEVQQTMDYRKKLDIYRKSQSPKQAERK